MTRLTELSLAIQGSRNLNHNFACVDESIYPESISNFSQPKPFSKNQDVGDPLRPVHISTTTSDINLPTLNELQELDESSDFGSPPKSNFLLSTLQNYHHPTPETDLVKSNPHRKLTKWAISSRSSPPYSPTGQNPTPPAR